MKRWIIQWAAQAYAEWFLKRYGKDIRDSAERESIRLYVWLLVQYHMILLHLSQSLERPEPAAELEEEDHTAELEAELAEITEVLRGFTPKLDISSQLNEQFSAISKIGRAPRVPQFWSGMDLIRSDMKGPSLDSGLSSITKRMIEATRISGSGSASSALTAIEHLSKYSVLNKDIATVASPFAKMNEKILAAPDPFKGINTQVAEAAKNALGGKSRPYTAFGAAAKADFFKDADTMAALTKNVVGSKSRTWMDFGAKPGTDFYKGTITGLAAKLGTTTDWRELTGVKPGLTTFILDSKELLGSASHHKSFLDSMRKDLYRNPWHSTVKQLDAFSEEIAFGMRPIHKQIADMEKQISDARKGRMFPPR